MATAEEDCCIDYVPVLHRQRSSAPCALFHFNRLRRIAGFTLPFEDEEIRRPAAGWPAAYGARLRGLWRKIAKEKGRTLNSVNSTTSTRVTNYYDPYTYAQHFDEGTAEEEPDRVGRSFSARFAATSRMNSTMH